MIVLGTNVYEAQGEVGEREERALETWHHLPNCRLVNLQFAQHGSNLNRDGFTTRAVLQLDSNQVCRRAGVRKPVVKEMLTALAQEAESVGVAYFGLVNADILLSPEIISAVETSGKTAMLFSRREVDPDGIKEICTYGIDAVFFRTDWWAQHRHRFRNYVLGEPCWDVVTTSIALFHGDGLLVNDSFLVQHVRHPIIWHDSPFAYHNWYLSALDSFYFSNWADYHGALAEMRSHGTTRAKELELQQKFFKRRWSWGQSLYHLGRCVRAQVRYQVKKWGGVR
jgi:hypothetical protein